MAMENNYIPNSDDVIEITAPSEDIIIPAQLEDITVDVADLIKEDLLKLSSNDTEYCRVWMADVFKILDKYLKKGE